jgi:hypothetical protein
MIRTMEEQGREMEDWMDERHVESVQGIEQME